MIQLKGQEELNQYKLTKKEIANYLGISTNAVRMSMRGNNYHDLEYRYDGCQYKFKVPKRHGANIADHTTLSHGPKIHEQTPPKTTPRNSKVINRGATHKGEGKYKSLALQMANEAKILKNIEGKFKSAAHKKIFNDMTDSAFDEAYKKSLDVKQQELQRSYSQDTSQDNTGVLSPRHHGKYGGMITAKGMQNIETKEHGRLARLDERKHGIVYKEVSQEVMGLDGKLKMEYKKTNIPDFTSTDTSYYTNGRNAGACYSGSTEPDVAAEFTYNELDRYGPVKQRTEFKNKIEESIHRARRQLLKDKGYY